MTTIQSNSQYKYYSIISMAYITAVIISIIFFNKIVEVGPLETSVALISYSLTYFFSNAVTEVYGYDLARRMIWSTVICGNGFTLLCNLLLFIPSPAYENHDAVLSEVMGGTFRSSAVGTIAMLAGAYVSTKIIEKTKPLWLGKGYWVRTLIASAAGEAVNSIIVFPLGMYGTIANVQIFDITLTSYLFKVIYAVLLAVPSMLFVYTLKTKEQIIPSYSTA